MTDMVETVARAIFSANTGTDYYEVYHPGFEYEQAHWETLARAAIEAMRTPTKAMLGAVEAEEDRRGYVAAAYESLDAEAAWPVMIDAALNEDGEKVYAETANRSA